MLAAKPELEYTPAGIIKQGQDVTFKCTFSEMGPFDYIKLVRKIGTRQQEISTNDVLATEFKKLGRYKATYDFSDDGTAVLTMTITSKCTPSWSEK